MASLEARAEAARAARGGPRPFLSPPIARKAPEALHPGSLPGEQEALALVRRLGLVTPREIVRGGVRVADASHRNTLYRIECEQGPSYLVKQGAENGRQPSPMLGLEGEVYGALAARPARPKAGGHGGPAGEGEMAPFMPAFYSFDRARSSLVIELVAGGRDLAEHHTRTGKFSAQLAGHVGRALATLHSTPPQAGSRLHKALRHSPHGSSPHWALSAHHPRLSDLPSLSNATIQAIKIIQRFPDFCRHLDTLRSEWSERAHVPIHCDLKWSNVIVAGPEPGRPRIRLVDWEFARLGDPCWDTGSFLGEYLTFWLLSVPVTGQDPPDRFVELARYPLEAMRPALRAFWLAYTARRELTQPQHHDAHLLRSVRYAALRLAQTAYEHGQASASLTGTMVMLLQLAFNILQRPRQAAWSLLGIHTLEPFSPWE